MFQGALDYYTTVYSTVRISNGKLLHCMTFMPEDLLMIPAIQGLYWTIDALWHEDLYISAGINIILFLIRYAKQTLSKFITNQTGTHYAEIMKEIRN